uniref:Uncharacterized protein n=1 Tax=Tanacetum cinerariifolium TaxID=118510 RepID=A0A6L2LVU9_TANCI|nr:hypothetical protein [Tanacetum cinerariifolium]
MPRKIPKKICYNLDHPSKVLSMQEDDSEVQEVIEVVTTAKLITDVVTAATSQVSAVSATISTAKPSIPAAALTVVVAYTRRRKGVIIRDPEEELSSKTPAETPGLKDKGKGILVETLKPMKKRIKLSWMQNMQGSCIKGKEMEEQGQEIIKSINETPAQKAAKRRKLNEEAQEAKELKKQLEIVNDEDDDVFADATPFGRKVPVVDYQIVMINNKPRYKIIKADETHQLYITTNFILLVERRYLLSKFTLEQLVNVARLQVEEESEMSLELLRFTRQQLQEYR